MTRTLSKMWGAAGMGINRVNLDAMITRTDLEAKSAGDSQSSGDNPIPISELVRGKLHFGLLRKPDFQRETNDWDIDNVVTLLKSFRDGRLIPSIILWRSNAGYSFVIDGAHRLSTFIAWVNDDYGDRGISQKFFSNQIKKRQSDIAEECRKQVRLKVGAYADLSGALTYENPTAERLRWAANISKALSTQYVVGDADAAQESFLAINQRAVAIDDTEKYMILSRRKPDVIAARALVSNAAGYQYWSRFPESQRTKIEALTKSIYELIFQPENEDIARSIELPLAGQAYSGDSLRMALELVQFANEYRPSKTDDLPDDIEGYDTIKYLEQVKAIFRRISGHQPASLGLHPAVYFWGATGRHHPTAVLAVINFMKELIKRDMLIEFSFHRAKFEEFLITEEAIIKHILGKYGGWSKSAPTVFKLYQTVFEGFRDGLSVEDIRKKIVEEPRFAGAKEALEMHESIGKKPTASSKATTRRRTLLSSAVRCPICHARLPSTVFSDDHKNRVQDGGRGTADNLQLTHPYCNHGLKEYLHHHGIEGPVNPFA